MANNFLRQVTTLPNFGVDLLVNANDAEIPAGDLDLAFEIPAGKILKGLIFRNMQNDLTGASSATVQLKVGGTALGSAGTDVTNIAGTSVEVTITDQVIDTPTSVTLTVVGGLTGGTLDIILLYI